MVELSRRERKKKETYENLFNSAMDLFRRQGYEQTTVEEITQLADVGKGTFYNYFPTKEAVVLEYSRRKYEELIISGREASYSLKEKVSMSLHEITDLSYYDCMRVRTIALRTFHDYPRARGAYYGSGKQCPYIHRADLAKR